MVGDGGLEIGWVWKDIEDLDHRIVFLWFGC